MSSTVKPVKPRETPAIKLRIKGVCHILYVDTFYYTKQAHHILSNFSPRIKKSHCGFDFVSSSLQPHTAPHHPPS